MPDKSPSATPAGETLVERSFPEWEHYLCKPCNSGGAAPGYVALCGSTLTFDEFLAWPESVNICADCDPILACPRCGAVFS